MQRQSASTAPGIATAPRSVVQIPMADGEQTGFPQVSAPASAAVEVPEEEEENNEDTESGNSDDDEDMDDINHTALPKEVVRPNTPTVRPQTTDIWKHVRRIAKHDVPDRAMKTECTHVCVYRLDDEDGEKRYCNTPLKLFRASSAKAAPWSTSAALAHFKKKHGDSSSARKQKAGAAKRQTRLSECMHAAGSQGIIYFLKEEHLCVVGEEREGAEHNRPMGHVY